MKNDDELVYLLQIGVKTAAELINKYKNLDLYGEFIR